MPKLKQKFNLLISSRKNLSAAPPGLQAQFVRLLLSKESAPADAHQIEEYFGPYRIPGTCSIGLRKQFPELFQDTLNDDIEPYDRWLTRILNQTIDRLESSYPLLSSQNPDAAFRVEVLERIRIILDFKNNDGISLCDLIPQQMYEDIFIRLISMIARNDILADEPYIYKNFNMICHRLSISLISCMGTEKMLYTTDACIRQLIHIAVLSGYVGINLKSSASAASTLLNRELIPINKEWIKDMPSVHGVPGNELEKVVRIMISLSQSPVTSLGLDSVAEYFKEVVDAMTSTLLVFFSDDYMESIIDLKRFEIMMKRNPKLDVLFVPRNGRYGNDFAADDIPLVLKDPAFKELSLFHQQGRFFVSTYGPMAGCIDTRFISETLIEQIKFLSRKKSLIFETKGCRNFEMIQGRLSVPWYTSFNCNRALSIRTVGIDMHPVFLRIPPGLKAYDGFKNPCMGTTPSEETKNVKFAQMTTRDLYNAIDGRPYKELLAKSDSEMRLNQALMKKSIQHKKTVHEILGVK